MITQRFNMAPGAKRATPAALTRQRLPHEPAEENSQITRAGNLFASKVSGWSYLYSQVHPAGEEDNLMTEVRPDLDRTPNPRFAAPA